MSYDTWKLAGPCAGWECPHCEEVTAKSERWEHECPTTESEGADDAV
jgi:hypothetical protein